MTPDSFLKTILEHPADDAPRLVYADWLDENGDSARSEFIRKQIELARTPTHFAMPIAEAAERFGGEYVKALRSGLAPATVPIRNPKWRELQTRTQDLLRKRRRKWQDGLAAIGVIQMCFFERGFVGKIKIDMFHWQRHWHEILMCAPITWLKLIYEGRAYSVPMQTAIEFAESPARGEYVQQIIRDYHNVMSGVAEAMQPAISAIRELGRTVTSSPSE